MSQTEYEFDTNTVHLNIILFREAEKEKKNGILHLCVCKNSFLKKKPKEAVEVQMYRTSRRAEECLCSRSHIIFYRTTWMTALL